MASQSGRRRREQRCEHCDKIITGGNGARHHKTHHAGVTSTEGSKKVLKAQVEEPTNVSGWLRSCAIDLAESDVPWPLDKLDRLPDLRTRPQETHDQCFAWQVFKDERITSLLSLERVLVSLDTASCKDVWRSNDPVRLTKDDLLEWKVQLLERKNPKIRLLNIPITEKLVSQDSQDVYHATVREKVQDCYGIGPDHPIEVHPATANITPRGTATEVHHDGDPHVSTAYGPSDARPDQPMKLWLLWKASENRRLSSCYSDTTAALDHLGPCGYLIQRAGESLMLPANVPHAALSLTSHMLYGQTFHVLDRASDPTTFGLEVSAGMEPEKAIEKVVACYKEGLRDPHPGVRGIHIDRMLCTMSAEQVIMDHIGRGSYMTRLIEALRNGRIFEGSCGLCEHFNFTPQHNGDCWEMHAMKYDQGPTAASQKDSQVRKTGLSIFEPKKKRSRAVDQNSRCHQEQETDICYYG